MINPQEIMDFILQEFSNRERKLKPLSSINGIILFEDEEPFAIVRFENSFFEEYFNIIIDNAIKYKSHYPKMKYCLFIQKKDLDLNMVVPRLKYVDDVKTYESLEELKELLNPLFNKD